MIDLHCHILPELDDGSRSFSESLEMARLAVESGITAVVATPHCIDDRTEQVQRATLLLREALEEAEIPLRLYMGMEIFGTAETARLLQEKKLFTINDSQYPLIEFSFRSSGREETEILQSVIRAGYRPLVAHPERYRYLFENPRLLNLWTRMGCLFQVTRGSLMGRFGDGPRRLGKALVERGFATVVASDAHSPRVRTPWLADVERLLSEEIAPRCADLLLRENPRKILKNEVIRSAEPEWFE